MKNKNILVGLGLGILTNLNNSTKKRTHQDPEYIERIIKLFNTSEEFDFQLRVRNFKTWPGGYIERSQISVEVIDKKNGNIITGDFEGRYEWDITFSGDQDTWDSAIDDNIRVKTDGSINYFSSKQYNLNIEFAESDILLDKYPVYEFYINYNYNDRFFFTLINKEQLIEYFKKSLEKRFPYYFFLLFVKEIPELFYKTVKENDNLLEYFVEFVESLEKDSDFSKKIKENDKLLKIIKDGPELIKFKKILVEIKLFFEKKSLLLNDIDSLLTEKKEILVKYKLWIILKNTLKKNLLEENYELSEDDLKLKLKIKDKISELESIYDFFDDTQPKILPIAEKFNPAEAKLFIDSLDEIYPLLSENFKENYELSENILKLNEDKLILIKIKDFFSKTEIIFELKSIILNYFTSLIIQNQEFLINNKLFITENSELQGKIEEFLKDKPELLNKLKSLLASK